MHSHVDGGGDGGVWSGGLVEVRMGVVVDGERREHPHQTGVKNQRHKYVTRVLGAPSPATKFK